MALLKDLIEKWNSLSDEEKEEFEAVEFKSADDIAGLEKKRDDLLGQNKKLRDRLKAGGEIPKEKQALLDILEKHSIIDTEDLEAVLSQKSEDGKLLQENSRLQKALESSKSKIEELNSANEKLNTQRTSDKVSAAISKALDNYSFASGYAKDLIQKEFVSKAQADMADDGTLSIFDSADGITPISDSIESWSKTDEAKTFLKAAVNKGGGAGGSSDGGSGKMTLEEISKLPTLAERQKAYADNGY